MRLTSFGAQRYRSIIKAETIPVGDMTVLVGPNNEGKSNILHALVVGMSILSQATAQRIRTGLIRYSATSDGMPNGYEWERDFPRALRDRQPDGKTVFDFEFELTEPELAQFRTEVRSQLVNPLCIRLELERTGTATFNVRKKGAGSPFLTKKRDLIARFLEARLAVEYVPAVRTSVRSTSIVERMLRRELMALRSNPDYLAALAQMQAIQQPTLDALGESLESTLKAFLPDVKSVRVMLPVAEVYDGSTHCQIILDDGTPTPLHMKGDGVQSLAALSLIRHASEEVKPGRELILAIEEPEAHLHPGAIHRLAGVLTDIAQTQQVVMTTHCPILVQRDSLGSNIVVRDNKARPASSVAELREVLGVRVHDNLASAEVLLIVEGTHDVTIVSAALRFRSTILTDALDAGRLAVRNLGGGSNLTYSLSEAGSGLLRRHVFVDNDQAGRRSIEDAEGEGLLRPSEVTVASHPSGRDAEIEDLIRVDCYASAFASEFNVAVTEDTFDGSGKWSSALKQAFTAQGQPWSRSRESAAKQRLAQAVAASNLDPVHPERAGPLEALVRALESKVAMAIGATDSSLPEAPRLLP